MMTQFKISFAPTSFYYNAVTHYLNNQTRPAELVAAYACHLINSVIQPTKTLPFPTCEYYSLAKGNTAFPTQLLVIINGCRPHVHSVRGRIQGLIDMKTCTYVNGQSEYYHLMSAVTRNTFFQVDRETLVVMKNHPLRMPNNHLLPFSPSFFLLDDARQEMVMASTDGKVAFFSTFPVRQLLLFNTHSPVDFAQCIGAFFLTVSIEERSLKLWKMQDGTLYKEVFWHSTLSVLSPSFTLSPNRDYLLMNGTTVFALPSCKAITRTNRLVLCSSHPAIGKNGVYAHVETCARDDTFEDTLRFTSMDNGEEMTLDLGKREYVFPTAEVYMHQAHTLLFWENTLFVLGL